MYIPKNHGISRKTGGLERGEIPDPCYAHSNPLYIGGVDPPHRSKSWCFLRQKLPLGLHKTHGRMKVLNPQYMGFLIPKNEENMGSHGGWLNWALSQESLTSQVATCSEDPWVPIWVILGVSIVSGEMDSYKCLYSRDHHKCQPAILGCLMLKWYDKFEGFFL